MEIQEFRKSYNTTLNDQLITSIVDYFLAGKVFGVNANQGLKSMYQYRNDGTKVNSEDYVALKDQLVLDRLVEKGINIFAMTDMAERKKVLDEVSLEVSNELSSSDELVLSTNGLVSNDTEDLDHEFFINVSAENYVSVLKAVYDVFKIRDLDGVRIVTPKASKVNVGLTDSIKILCSTEDLEYVVKALESLEKFYKDKCDEVPAVYPKVSSFYGYSQLDKVNNRTAVENISRLVLLSMNDVVTEFVETNKDTATINGEPITTYMEKTRNRVVAIQTVINVYKEDLMPKVLGKVKDKASEAGINLANIYVVKSVENAVVEKYGAVSYQAEFEAREAALEEAKEESISVIPTPVSFSLPEEIQAMEAQTEANKDVVRDEQYLDGLLQNVENSEVINTPVEVIAPAVEAPAIEEAVVETPEVEAPVIEEAVVETPVVETPAEEEVVAETPVAVSEEMPVVQVDPIVEVANIDLSNNGDVITPEVTEEVTNEITPEITPEVNESMVQETPVAPVAPAVPKFSIPSIPAIEEGPLVIENPDIIPEVPLDDTPEVEAQLETEEQEEVVSLAQTDALMDTPVIPMVSVVDDTPLEEVVEETEEESIVVSPATVDDMAVAMENAPIVETPVDETPIVVSALTTSDVLGENHELGEPEVPVEEVEEEVQVTTEVPPIEITESAPIVPEVPVVTPEVVPEETPVVTPEIPARTPFSDEEARLDAMLASVMNPQVVEEVASEETPVVTPEVAPVIEAAPVIEEAVVETPVVETPVAETPVVTPAVEEELPTQSPVVMTEDTLTTEEVNSVVNDGLELSGGEAVVKYQSIMENIADLNFEVKGQGMTILQFFEVNNLLGVLEPTDYVQLHPEIGGTITAKEFVSNYLVQYLTQSGEGDLKYIIDLYASSTVKNVAEPAEKKGLFKGLFKGKK